MPYVPVNWVDLATDLSAANLNHLEGGVQTAQALAEAALPTPGGTNGQFLQRVSGVWVPHTLAAVDMPSGIPASKLAAYPSDPTLFLRGDGSWVVPSSTPPIVTALPGSPTDGQECYLTDSLTAPTYRWHLQYEASQTKWHFIGGAPLFAEVTANETTASTTYVALATAGPAIALPLAGDYDVGEGFTGAAGNNVGGIMSYDIGATGAVDADKVRTSSLTISGGGSQPASAMRIRRKTGLTAVTLTAKYKSPDGGSIGFENRWMRVTPVRLG